ncbi:Protein CHROMOSOME TRANSMISSION FIDELITY 7 [Chlorella vulgaris]
MHGGIRSFFEPAAKSCKRGPHKQQPSLGTGDVSIADGAADEAALPPAAAANGPRAVAARPLTQMYLDVGQRDFHLYRCPACGMLYARGTEADERLHASFHASAAQGPRYQGWQGERVAAVDGSKGRLLLFNSADQKRGRKLQELCGFLEEQLGLPRGWLLRVPLTLLLYVSAARRIQACVAAETIREAFHVKPPSLALNPQQQGLLSCESAAAPANSSGAPVMAQQQQQQQQQQGNAAARSHLAAPAAAAAHVATSGLSLLSVTLSSGSVAAAATALAECSGAACGPSDSCCGAALAIVAAKPLPPPSPQREQRPQPRQQSAVDAPQQRRLPTAAAPTAAGCEALELDRRQRVRAVCGVRVMWVSLEARRQGLATRLLDCCRCQLTPGYVVPRHELAFSAPTEAGRAFIEAYAGTRRFLVYE